jgi:hypothetical protein
MPNSALVSALDPIFQSATGQVPDLNQLRSGAIARADVVYECYLYALALQALVELQYSPKPHPAGNGPFVFRRGRGMLHTLKTGCSYIDFTVNGVEYELLCDVQTLCKSPNVVLEVDILILPKAHSDSCVAALVPPTYQHLKLLLEAKNYSAGIDVTTTKSFIGVCDRLRDTTCVAAIVTSGPHTPDSKLLLDGVNPVIDLYSNIHGDPSTGTPARSFVDFLKAKLPTVL